MMDGFGVAMSLPLAPGRVGRREASCLWLVRLETLEEALRFLVEHEGVAVLVVGQSLVTTLNLRLASPEHVVDINRIERLSFLVESANRKNIDSFFNAFVAHVRSVDKESV
ncbi:MAG: FAD binding domain-containing protein [Steroidobacteraceae bacterium]